MSYTKKTWASGDTVTSSALNNMEGGIDAAANPFVVTLTPTNEDFSGTMDKTPAEITEAFNAGKEIRVAVPALGGLVGICVEFSPDGDYISLWCNFVANFPELGGYMIITVVTNASDSTYGTVIFPLTPMS